MESGKFIISLDFELHWGGAEKWDIVNKKTYFNNTRIIVDQLLKVFEENKLPVTWATVGILFAATKDEFLKYKPEIEPTYINENLNYYSLLKNDEVGKDETEDPYHFAATLVRKIKEAPLQELSTHTFAHYYCNEKGQNITQFKADIEAAQKIAHDKYNVRLKSIVLPRNQFNKNYINTLAQAGIKVVRSNPDVWFWNKISLISPIFRALDTLFKISKSLSYKESDLTYQDTVLLLPASRFLRPYARKERLIQKLKTSRIKREMKHAAKNNRVYHLWWHPHNFGYFPKENMKQLLELIEYYNYLKQKYNFQACSMIEMHKK